MLFFIKQLALERGTVKLQGLILICLLVIGRDLVILTTFLSGRYHIGLLSNDLDAGNHERYSKK